MHKISYTGRIKKILDNSASDRDANRQRLNFSDTNKTVIYDTDEEFEDLAQQSKRQRKSTKRESIINPIDNDRLKNIKFDLFTIIKDKDKTKKSTLEFQQREECGTANASWYDEIINERTPSKPTKPSSSSEENVETPKIRITSPKNITTKILSPQISSQRLNPLMSSAATTDVPLSQNPGSRCSSPLPQSLDAKEICRTLTN